MQIVDKEVIAKYQGQKIVKLKVEAAEIAQKAKPGQFVVVMVSDVGERTPLTIVEADKEKGFITLIVQEAGLTTKLLAKLKTGDSLYALSGPLGHPTKIKKYGKVILVAGGVGIAEIYPVAKAFKEAGNYVITILGAKNKDLLILEDKLKEVSDESYVTTDDGSKGKKGFVTDALRLLLSKEGADLVYAVGPIIMMEKVSKLTLSQKINTLVSLNALMVDATGMCGCCRVTVSGKVKFTCVDGPEFEAHNIDWQELAMRNSMYESSEKHICKLKKL